MNRIRLFGALTLVALASVSQSLRADVRADEKARVEFAGLFGKVVNLFGGKAAKEGVVSMHALKGARMATMSDVGGQIIDLNEEKIYTVDTKKKSYTVMTFAELRRQMEEARKKAAEDLRKEQEKEAKDKKEAPPARDPNEKELDIDFTVKNTGEKKTINGFDTSESIMTITLREKGKTLEQSGGLVLTSDMWLAPKITAMKEISDFYVRYAQKLGGPMVAGASAEDMAAAMAMYPAMKEAIARMNAESAKLEGTAILTTVKIDAVKSADQVAAEAKSKDEDSKPSAKGGLGGLVGGMARRAAQKKSDGQNESKDRATFMTMTSEMLKVSTDVSAADVAVPAGFKEGR
jgi:hypothetical protein